MTTQTGVMVYAIAYWTNTFGDPFLKDAISTAAAGSNGLCFHRSQ